MASSSSMLTFPVGFDFSGAIKAEEIKKALDRAEKIVKGKPIVVTASFDRTGLDSLEFYYDHTIRKIESRIARLNKAWSKLSPGDIYAPGKTELSDMAVNVGTKAKPEMLSPKQIYAEWEQLTMLLQLAGKTLSQIHQERMKNMDAEERAMQKQMQQIEKETAARARQSEIVNRLSDKILSSQIAREDTSRQVTAISKATDAYAAQDKVVQRLTSDLSAQIAAKVKLESTGKAYNKDGTQTKAYTDALQRELELTKQLATAESDLTAKYERQFQLLQQIGLSANQTPLGALAANPAASAAIDAQIAKYNQLKAQINAVTADFERLKALQLQAGGAGYEDIINQKLKLRAQLEKELAKITQTADQAQAEMLRRQEALQSRIEAKERKRVTAMVQRIAKLNEERQALSLQENTINNIQKKIEALNSQKARTDFLGDPAKFKQLNDEINRLQKLLDQVSGKQEKAKKASQEHTKSMEYQKGVLDRLVQRMAVYASFGALMGFAQKVRDVTAEFERQRVALGAIIQDQVRGNALFSEIKAFALKSPIKILDLTKYTKQVAAYRIETDKLFDTTKRLADVSVGLGVDMQRLVLAYGQVKAATYLRASELRQFTEAGIPMLELLSQKFTEVEGRMVSTADVMKRISKRGVEFKEVEQVFKDMTDAGGMFYNMQEKLGNTLYGMWAKLGDAASIMYDEIGNTSAVGDGIRNVIQTLSRLMRNWRAVGAAAATVSGMIAMFITTLKVYGAVQAANTMITKQNTAAQIADRAALVSKNAVLSLSCKIMQKFGYTQAQATAYTLAFSKALKMIGMISFGAVMAGLTWLVEKIYEAYHNSQKLKNALADIDKESGTEQMKSVRNFESLAKAAVKAYQAGKDYNSILDELHRTYKDIIPLEKMTIENLQGMNGNYQALTQSIRDYVAERMKQKKIDTIIDVTGAKMIEAEKEFKSAMKDTWDENQVERFMAAFQKSFDKSRDFAKSYKEAAENIGADMMDLSSDAFRQLIKYSDALKEQIVVIDAVESAWTRGYEALGRYGDGYKKLVSEVNEKPIASVGGISVDSSDYLYQQQRKNMQIYEAMVPQLREMLKDAGVAWQEGWGYLIKEVDKSAPEMISAINWDLIDKYLSENISKIPNEQKQAIEGLRKLYDEIAPTDKQTRIVRERFTEIVQAVTGGMEKMSQYSRFLKTNGQDVKDYVKFLDEQIDELSTQITELEDVASIGARVSLFARNIFSSITGGEVLTIDDLKEQIEVLKKARADFSSYSKEKKTGRGRTASDPRLQILNDMASTLEKINRDYDELRKKESDTQALEHVKGLYADMFEQMKELNTKYKFGLPMFDVPKNAAEVKQWYDTIYKKIKDLKLKDSDKTLIDLQYKAGKIELDELQNDIEKKLKELSEQVARSKAAKDFFDKIFTQTKNYDMAMQLTMDIYGDAGENYQQQIIEQVRTAFGAGQEWEIDITPAIDVNTGAVNYNMLERMLGSLPKDYQDNAKKIVSDLRKVSETQATQWAKDLEKAKTYAIETVELSRWTATQKLAIEQELAERIAAIRYDQQQGKIDEDTADAQIAAARKAADDMLAGYDRRQQRLQQNLDFDFLKNSALYTTAFDNLDSLSKTTLEKMRERFSQLRASMSETLTPNQYAEFVKKIQDIDAQLAKHNPIKQLVKNWKEYIRILRKNDVRKAEQDMLDNEIKLSDAAERLKKALEDEADASDKLAEAKSGGDKDTIAEAQKALDLAKRNVDTIQKEVDELEKQKTVLQEIIDRYNNAKSVIAGAAQQASEFTKGIGTAFEGLAKWSEIFGGDEEDVQFFQDVADGLNEIAGGIDQIISSAMSGNIGGIIGGVISAPASIVSGFISIFSAGRVRRANKEIKRQQELLDALSYSHDRLSDMTEKVFGSEYIANYNQRLENLQAQQEAYLKQAEAERSKGKKKDKDKIKEYEEAARDAADEIADMQSELAETLAGTDVASAARDFANAWLDAYVSFEGTTQAIKEKFNDMIKNMIVESAMGQIVKSVLQPFYEQIKEAALSDGQLTAQEVVDLADRIPAYTNQITDGLQIFANQLEALGYDLHDLGDTGEFTGIARDIASASEESITGLAAMINTQNYYISNVPLIYQEVALIRQLLSGENPAVAARSPMLDTTDLQNEYLSHLPAIHANTEAIADRCERAAAACESIADSLSGVIKPRGIASANVINIS